MYKKPTYEELEAIIREHDRLEKKIKQIFDLSPDMIGSANLEGYFININRSFEKILGYTPAEFCSKPFLFFVHDDDRKKTEEALISASRGTKLIEIENRYRCKNNDYKWIDWKVWDTGDGDTYIAMGRDINGRKRLEEMLAASKQRYETITTVAQDCIFTKNENRQYTFVNPAMTDLLDHKGQGLIGKTPEQLFEPEIAAVIKAVDDKTFNGESVNEIKSLKIHGKEYFFHTVQVPLEQRNGKVFSISGIVRDITASVRAQERKEQIETQQLQIQKLEAIGTLAGGIAHDFNNMLGVIIGNASYAQCQLNQENPLYEVLSNIQAGAMQAQGLTQQLLTFARGGAPIKKATDLNRFIEESARFLTRGSKSRCDFEFAADLWAAEVDSGQIHQAISNIIINASQAMPDGGTIKIKTENTVVDADNTLPLSAGKYIRVIIEDQGVGISDKHLSKIFDPYFTTKQKGSGLGLATTYSIIKRHDGHITAHSRRDEGTVFTIYLPACTEKCEDVETRGTEHSGSGKILVMDDHQQILTMSGIMLNQMGYETAFATDGLQAIEIYRQALQAGEPFDLVILDLTVPGGMGGDKAIQALLKIEPGVKAVVSSGYSNDPIMANYEDYGFCGVLPKPYTKNQLAETLNKIFGREKRL